METQTTTPETENRKPEFRLSLVRQTSMGDQWAEIGVGWRHSDGEGISFTGGLLKLFGFKIVARPIKSRD